MCGVSVYVYDRVCVYVCDRVCAVSVWCECVCLWCAMLLFLVKASIVSYNDDGPSQDATVRQFDIRVPHTCRRDCSATCLLRVYENNKCAALTLSSLSLSSFFFLSLPPLPSLHLSLPPLSPSLSLSPSLALPPSLSSLSLSLSLPRSLCECMRAFPSAVGGAVCFLTISSSSAACTA